MINIDQICQELRVRPEIYKKIVTDFSRSLPEKMNALNEAITAKDAKRVREITHEIKGISSNLRITDIKDIATSIHDADIENIENIENLFKKLNTKVEELQSVVNKI